MWLPAWWRRHFLNTELLLALVLGLGFFIWTGYAGGYLIVDSVLREVRPTLYSALATIYGSLFGFVIATVTIVLGFSGSPRLELVRNSTYYPTLWRVFSSTVRVLACATLAALVALVFDRADSPAPLLLSVIVFSGLLAVFRLGRCIWVLENVIKIVTKPTPRQP
jgi:hypothetical protein